MKLSCCFKERETAVQCVTDVGNWFDVHPVVRDAPDENGWYWLDCLPEENEMAFRAVQLWQSASHRGRMSQINRAYKGY